MKARRPGSRFYDLKVFDDACTLEMLESPSVPGERFSRRVDQAVRPYTLHPIPLSISHSIHHSHLSPSSIQYSPNIPPQSNCPIHPISIVVLSTVYNPTVSPTHSSNNNTLTYPSPILNPIHSRPSVSPTQSPIVTTLTNLNPGHPSHPGFIPPMIF